jgi:hypothetical protein
MTNWRKVFSLPGRGSVDPLQIHNVLGIRSSTVAAWYAGYTSAGDLVDIMGNGRNLADNNAPTVTASVLQGADGNRLQAIKYVGASTQSHALSVTAGGWADIWDADFTATCVFMADSLASNQCLFSKGSSNTDGVNLNKRTDGTLMFIMRSSGSQITTPISQVSVVAGRWNVAHIVRQNNIVRVMVNGVSGAPINCTGYGVDAAVGRDFFIGNSTSGDALDGQVAYLRLNNVAISDAKIQREVMLWVGAGLGSTWEPVLECRRSGNAYQTYSNGTMALRGSNMPRVGNGLLVEGAATNKLTYTGAISTNWTKTKCSIAATSVTLPDGTASTTASFQEDGTNGEHVCAHSAVSIDASGSMCGSVYIKGISSITDTHVVLRLSDIGGVNCRINPLTGEVVATAGTPTVEVEAGADGWFRVKCSKAYVGGTTSSFGLVPYNTTASNTSYLGTSRELFYFAFPQYEQSAFATSYTANATTSTTNGRPADDIQVPTYRLRNTLKDVISTTPTMWLDFDTTPSGATITDKSGTYTLTKAGQPKRYTSPVYGDYHAFDGTNDYYSSTNAVFTPTGDFSVVVVFTPNTVAAGQQVICGKWNSIGNQRGWLLYRDGSSISFNRSTDGTGGTQVAATKLSSLVANKPCLITATYSTIGGLTVRVDALTAATAAAIGVVFSSSASFYIGVEGDLTNKLNGNLHYLAYYNGTVLTAQNHADMYAALKQSGILPLSMSASTHYTKLRVRGAYRHIGNAAGITATGPVLVDVSGNIGSADADTNRVRIYLDGTNFAAAIYASGESTRRQMEVASANDTRWNSFDVIFDLANLANSSGTHGLLGGTQTALTLDGNMTGTNKTVSFLDTAIRIGSNMTPAAYANAYLLDIEGFIA